MQIRGSNAGGALRLSLPCKSSVVIPGSPSARLTRGLMLNTGQWLLRFSVSREPPMTSTLSIPFQKAKMSRNIHFFSGMMMGSFTVKVVPSPRLLLRSMAPPIFSMIL
jgi:hypothetical protein